MNKASPFSFLEALASRVQPPAWLVDEGQQRVVLFLNHVVMQEPEAQSRLARKKGSVVHLRWGMFSLELLITPAGLTDRAPVSRKPDLVLTVASESPMAVAQAVMQGKPPPVNIEGDVQLAAELGWLAENLRWDVEEDLSRVIGDVPAHTLAGIGRRVKAAIQEFIGKASKMSSPFSPAATAATPAPATPAATAPVSAPGPAAAAPNADAFTPRPGGTGA
ncbi:MAG: hypothetical protein V4731_14675 [Pseudomonadota bacterium]